MRACAQTRLQKPHQGFFPSPGKTPEQGEGEGMVGGGVVVVV